MSEPTRVCPACYGFNRWLASYCKDCGASLASEDDLDSRLVWALRHPDTATAIRAAQALAARRVEAAIPALAAVAAMAGDPYRSAAAAVALASFAGGPEADAALARAENHPSVIVRAAVERARAQGGIR